MSKKKFYVTQDFYSPYLRRAIGKGAFKKGEKIELDAKTAEMFAKHFSDKPPKEDKPPSTGKSSSEKRSTPPGAPAAAKEK